MYPRCWRVPPPTSHLRLQSAGLEYILPLWDEGGGVERRALFEDGRDLSFQGDWEMVEWGFDSLGDGRFLHLVSHFCYWGCGALMLGEHVARLGADLRWPEPRLVQQSDSCCVIGTLTRGTGVIYSWSPSLFDL